MLRYLVFRLLAGVTGALVAGCVVVAVAGEPSTPEVSTDRPGQEFSIEELRAWGIVGNCIENHRVRNIRFRDDESAVIHLTGGKKVLMTLERRCPGIRSRGFIHRTRINRLCATDTLRVIDTGSMCMIRDFMPLLDDGPNEQLTPVDSGGGSG